MSEYVRLGLRATTYIVLCALARTTQWSRITLCALKSWPFLTNCRLLHDGHLTHYPFILDRWPYTPSTLRILVDHYPFCPDLRYLNPESERTEAHHLDSVACVESTTESSWFTHPGCPLLFSIISVNISISPPPQSNNLISILAQHQSWQLQLVHLLWVG